HDDLFILLAIKTVSQRGGRRLVDNAAHVQTRDFTGELGRLALRVVEIGRNRDHGFGNFFANARFGVGLQFLQNFRGDFFRRQFLATHHHAYALAVLHDFVRQPLKIALHFDVIPTTTDQTLHREQRVFRIHHTLALGDLARELFAGFRYGDHGRRRTRTFGIFEHFGLATFNHGHTRIGRSEVDTENFGHNIIWR